jgi:parvulin-like peptidyl-prolyl isomerase
VSERAQAEQTARKKSDEMLGSTAGHAWPQLWAMVQAYEQARLSGDAGELAAVEARLNQAFAQLNTGPDFGNQPISGEVAQVIQLALAYRTQVEEQTRSEAEYFTAMVERYDENPAVFVQRAWTEMLEKVLDPANDVEVYYYKDKAEIRLSLQRDPDIHRRREEKKLLEDQERYRRQAQELQRR